MFTLKLLNPPPFIKVPACTKPPGNWVVMFLYISGIDLPLSAIFLLDFGTVSTVVFFVFHVIIGFRPSRWPAVFGGYRCNNNVKMNVFIISLKCTWSYSISVIFCKECIKCICSQTNMSQWILITHPPYLTNVTTMFLSPLFSSPLLSYNFFFYL